MTVLGIDSGFANPGAAVVVYPSANGEPPWLALASALVTKPLAKKARKVAHTYKSEDDARRVTEISDWLADLIANHNPDHVVIELPSAGAKSAGGIRGMALGAACAVATCWRLGYHQDSLHYVTPGQNKLGSAGDRFAEKTAVLAAVQRAFPGFNKWPTKLDRRRQPVLDQASQLAAADAASAVLTWLAQVKSHNL